MAPLQPLQQTVFEQGPQAATVPTGEPIPVYQEGQVILPEPINPAVALDPGVNWYGLGEQAMKIAQDLTTETWDYLIRTKANNIADITMSKGDKLNKIAFEAAMLQEQIKKDPYSPIDYEAKGREFGQQIKQLELDWDKEALEILGPDDYAAFTADKTNMKQYGLRWQDLAGVTKKSKLGLSNQIREVLKDLAVMDLSRKEAKETQQFFFEGRPMSRAEMEKVPYAPVYYGETPLPPETLSVFQDPQTKEPLTVNGAPIYYTFTAPDGSKYNFLNITGTSPNRPKDLPVFNFDDIPVDMMRAITIMDMNSYRSENGVNVHYKALDELWLLANKPPTEASMARAMLMMRMVPPEYLTPEKLRQEPGRNLGEANRLAFLYGLSRVGATPTEALATMSTPDLPIDEVMKVVGSIQRPISGGQISIERLPATQAQLQDDIINATNIFGISLATSSGLVGEDVESFIQDYSISTEVLGFSDNSLRYSDAEGPAGSVATLMELNPTARLMVARAVIGARKMLAGKNLSKEERKTQFEAAIRGIIDSDIANSGTTIGPNNVVFVNPNVSPIMRLVKPELFRQAGSVAKLSAEDNQMLFQSTPEERYRMLGAAYLRSTPAFPSNMTDQQIKEAQLNRIRVLSRNRVSLETASALYDMLVETSQDPLSSTSVSNRGFSEGALLQIAVAAMPETWAATGSYRVPENILITEAAKSLSPQEQAQYAIATFNQLSPAWNWDINFNTSRINFLESDNGGLPITFTSIPTKDGKDIVPDVFLVKDKTTTGWEPIKVDGEPLLVLNTSTVNTDAYYAALPDQVKTEVNRRKTNLPQFDTTLQVKSDQTPNKTVDTNMDNYIEMMDGYRPQGTDPAYSLVPQEIRSLPVRNKQDLLAIFTQYQNETVIPYSENDPVLKDRKNNPLHNFARQYSSKSGLFREENVEKLMEWASTQTKEDGTPMYQTAGDYLALFAEVARKGTNNNTASVSSVGYNADAIDEPRVTAEEESTPYTAFASQFKKKPIATSGKDKGLILWDRRNEKFWDTAIALQDAGFSIVSEKETNRLFAVAPNEQMDEDRFTELTQSELMSSMALKKLQRQMQTNLNPNYKKPTPTVEEPRSGWFYNKDVDWTPQTYWQRKRKTLPSTTQGMSWWESEKFQMRSMYEDVLGNPIVEPLKFWWQNSPTPDNTVEFRAPSGKPTVSPGALGRPVYMEVISEFEGLKTEAYYDKNGKVWTIGKGTTRYPDGTKVKEGDTITAEQADEYAMDYIQRKIIPTLERTIPTWADMNKNQKAAIISFAYNVGPNFYKREGFETITRVLSSVDTFKDVPAALALYKKSGGKVLDGLVRRRAAEGRLFMTEPNYEDENV